MGHGAGQQILAKRSTSSSGPPLPSTSVHDSRHWSASDQTFLKPCAKFMLRQVHSMRRALQQFPRLAHYVALRRLRKAERRLGKALAAAKDRAGRDAIEFDLGWLLDERAHVQTDWLIRRARKY